MNGRSGRLAGLIAALKKIRRNRQDLLEVMRAAQALLEQLPAAASSAEVVA